MITTALQSNEKGPRYSGPFPPFLGLSAARAGRQPAKLRRRKMTRRPILEANKKPIKQEADDQSHKPAEHIEEVARLASSVETAKDPGKVRRTKD